MSADILDVLEDAMRHADALVGRAVSIVANEEQIHGAIDPEGVADLRELTRLGGLLRGCLLGVRAEAIGPAEVRGAAPGKAIAALQQGLRALNGYPQTSDVDSPEARACVAARTAVRRALHFLGAERGPLGDVEISMARYCNEDGTTKDGEDDGPSEWIVALRAAKETASLSHRQRTTKRKAG